MPGRMPSLFSRLTRYQPLLQNTQRENQHTEALAATLETDQDLARAVLREVLAAASSEANPENLPAEFDVSVRTQVPADGRDFVDLELRAGPIARPLVRVWFEIKLEAELGPNQLERYAKALRRRGGETKVIVFLHKPDRRSEAGPDKGEVEFLDWTWQQLAHAIARAPGPRSSLADHLLTFLNEGGLAVTDALTPAHLLALEEQERAATALDFIWKAAVSLLTAERGGGEDDYDVKWGRFGSRWWIVEATRGESDPGLEAETGVLELHLSHRDEAPPLRGIVFGAGLTLHRQESSRWEVLRGAAEADGFVVFEDGRFLRIWRILSLSRLLGEQDLEEQIACLCAWTNRAIDDAESLLARG